MADKTLIRQSQLRCSDDYDDTVPAGSEMEYGENTTISHDLNAIRSQLCRILGSGHWYDTPYISLAAAGDLASAGRMLINFIDEGPAEGFVGGYKEITGIPWPTAVTWYVDATKADKIVEKLITRNSDQAPTEIVWRLYDDDGSTVILTATDVISNTGTPPIFEVSRTRTIT